jgi:hypothetical protein
LLLLVLILVLIAFGLLVVALLSGSVLWAWVSVGVSVVAAAVLLVDWLQRRSAVRAGADAGRAAPLPAAAAVPPPHLPGRDPVVEPATEVLPVVRADVTHAGSSPVDADTALDGRDERPDPQETVVLRAVTPPGSTKRPSGAPDGTGSPEADSSQSVTTVGDDAERGERSDGAPADAREGETGDADADAEATVKVAAANRGEVSGVPAGSGAVAALGGPTAVGGPPPADLPPLGPDGAPPEEPHDADAAELVAELDDEVLVVDELPRYHQAGCRSLANTPVIPLPAREAVELGFTPCAWCTPNRALSSRHRAGAR